MNVTKTGWVIAATVAAAFAAGCATQGQTAPAGSCGAEPAVAATHACKNVAECKAKVAKHHHHHRHAAKAVKTEKVDADVAVDATTPAEGDAAK